MTYYERHDDDGQLARLRLTSFLYKFLFCLYATENSGDGINEFLVIFLFL